MAFDHLQTRPAVNERTILIVDDERINREILGMMLSGDYKILYAENGEEALEQAYAAKDRLSLVLLDVLMPVMDGFQVLEKMKADPALSRIPVIVLTTEKSYEVKCLRLGAADFITKPYDLPEVVHARVQRTIQLSEDTRLIQNTEFDPETGLYTPEYFFRYAEDMERLRPDINMDAIYLDISHFQLLNEMYGREYGSEVIQKLTGEIRAAVSEVGGIAGAKDNDVFLLFVPAAEDQSALLDRFHQTLVDDTVHTAIRLRMGVCPAGDRKSDIRRRFDWAKHARDTLHSSFSDTVAYYDDDMHEQALYRQRLVDEMESALAGGQFKVYYQPKFNVTGEKPVLSSAEALIRWIHPQKGMISPGVFIPLFEENGLISKLDRFVWKESARQVREWRDKYGFSLPVSVNVSRVDLFDPALVETLKGCVEENGLTTKDLLLEVTESAYTQNAKTIVEKVERLRSLGFRIEMDDFGSGYSSLNMLTELPIDVLKLDMMFIRNLKNNEKNLYVLKLMMEIKTYFSVPIVAEGVETEEQLELLKNMGCDVIQGYYFSAPVPPEKFEAFVEERSRLC